jgi:hypothetical protein
MSFASLLSAPAGPFFFLAHELYDCFDSHTDLLCCTPQILKPHLEAGERVALMGDLNTLSRHDSRQHEDAQLPQMLRRTDLQVAPCCVVCVCFAWPGFRRDQS